ncbi:MAG TPA: hypothetical protein VFV63_13470 [Ilumatobacteraceae bacterium]|nr:hypothetical protein [Ilumatobacteraceae bacterium]
MAVAQAVPESVAPVAIVSGREVALSWSATTLTGGAPAESYTVRRYDTSNVAQTVLTGCDVVTTTSCVENNVPIGAWTYSVQAKLGSWTGAEGSPSATITVAASSLVLDSTAPIGPLPAAVTGAIANFLVAEALTYRLDSPTGPVLAGSPATVTSSTSTAVSVTLPAGTSSAPHSIFVVGSGGSFAAAAVDISVPPKLQSMRMSDVDGDGKVDQVTVVFDDTLAAYSAGIAPWTLTNVPSGGSLSSVVVNGATATLTIAEGLGAANTAVGTFRVALATNAAGIRDMNGPQSSFAATAPTDVAAPARVASTMQDVSANGKIDRLTVTFSEALSSYTAPTTVWTLSNVPSGGLMASVTVVTATATIAITEGPGPLDTSVGSFTVALTADPAGIRDAAGNLASFAIAPTDAARPIRQSAQMFDDNADGKIDRVLTTFSETLAPFTAAATVFVLTAAPSGATVNTVNVSGNQATLALNQGAAAANTAVGSFRVALSSDVGGIRDTTGNLSSHAATAPTDRAAPVRVSSTMQDVSANGRVDRVTAVFSESLQAYAAGIAPWTLTNVPSGGSLASVTAVTATVTIAITEGAGPLDTSVGSFTVALAADPAGIRDAAGNLASFATITPTDGAKPIRQSTEMFDDDSDGKIDRVLTTFSETLAPFTAPASVFVLTAAPSGATVGAATVSANQAALALNQGVAAANTAVGSFRVALTSNIGGIRDTAGNLSSHVATAPTDRAAPVLVTLALLDSNGNGKVDRVTALFSESLQAYSAGTAPWTLTNVPSGGTLTSVSRAAATLTLTLAEGAAAPDTQVGAMTVAMAANGVGARDAAGQLGAFATATPLDRAKPAAVTITDTNGTLDGKAQPGDAIAITFSEPLAPASVPSSTTVTMTDPVGTGNDTLTMAGVSNGARVLGSNNYVTVEATSASFDNSTVTQGNANRTITVTIAAACTGTGCAGLGQQAANATYSFVGATTLTDVAGNPASTARKTQRIRLF